MLRPGQIEEFAARFVESPALGATAAFVALLGLGVLGIGAILVLLQVSDVSGGAAFAGRRDSVLLAIGVAWISAASAGALGTFILLRLMHERQASGRLFGRAARTRALLDAVFDSAYLPIFVIDPEREVVVEANRRAHELLGVPDDDCAGMSIWRFHPDNKDAMREFLHDALVRGPIESDKLSCATLAGEAIPAEIFASRFMAAGRELIIAVCRDLRQTRAAEAALIRAKEEAERASNAKSQFLANVSHELRTPLNAINGFSKIILDGVQGEIGNDTYRSYIADIHDSGTHLLDLINDILTYTRIEAGEFALREDSVDVRRLVTRLLAEFAERLTRDQAEIIMDPVEQIPRVWADPKALKQILTIHLSNAVKFTSGNGVVRVGWEEDGESDEIRLLVSDTGIGIAREKIENILKPFQQADGELSRKFEGAGLGLPLSRALVELHGGRLEMESEEGVGTRVVICLPAERRITDN